MTFALIIGTVKREPISGVRGNRTLDLAANNKWGIEPQGQPARHNPNKVTSLLHGEYGEGVAQHLSPPSFSSPPSLLPT